MTKLIASSIAIAIYGSSAMAQAPTGIVHQPPAPNYAGRIARAYDRIGKNLLIVRSSSAPADLGVARFDEDANLYYFTGAERMLGGILVLDGNARRAELFLPSRLPADLQFFAGDVRSNSVSPGSLNVDRVSDWRAFAAYVDQRLATDSAAIIYVDAGGVDAEFAGTLGTPLDSLATLANSHQLWRRSVHERWPKADVRGDDFMLEKLRAVKDAAEVATMRRVGAASAAAFLSGLVQFAPGRRQRAAEATVVATCLRLGDGPSFWPWAMSGPNSAFPLPFTSAVDPHHLDRVMRSGEVARFDIGCAVDHYMGDVGRTVPVSGRFTTEQAEVVDLLAAAYRAGIATIRDGATIQAVIAASVEEVKHRQAGLRSPLAKEAAATITRADGIPFWQLHGIGLESAEVTPDTLRAGMVVDYEPIFVAGGQGFYMEDMLLVTAHGAETLTKGLPSTAAEIERAMRVGPRSPAL